MEELCVALEEQFRARDIPLHADAVEVAVPDLPRHAVLKDKSPYKTHVAASFGWAGDGVDAAAVGRSHTENVHASGGYFHLQPGEIYVGGGVWHPEKAWLDAFRGASSTISDGFQAIVEAPAFRKTFGDRRRRRRVAQARPARLPAGPSSGRPAPDEERDVRAPAVGRRGDSRRDLPDRHRRQLRRRDAADALPGDDRLTPGRGCAQSSGLR